MMGCCLPAVASATHDKAPTINAEHEAKGSVDIEKQAQSDQQKPGSSIAVVSPAQSAREQEGTKQDGNKAEQEGTEFWPAFRGYKIKITDSLLVIFTFALTFFTGLLWLSTEKLWSAGEQQIKIATQSAEIATLALEAAETPYLYPVVTPWSDGDPLPPGKSRGLLSYHFKNHGRSPAIIREIHHGAVEVREMPQPIGFPPPQTNLWQSELVGPGETSSVRRLTHSAITRRGDSPDPHSAICLMGQVRYADVFGNQFLSGFTVVENSFARIYYALGGVGFNYRRKLTPDEMILANERDGLPTGDSDGKKS